MRSRPCFEAAMLILTMGAAACNDGASAGGGASGAAGTGVAGASVAGASVASANAGSTQSVNLPGCADGEPDLMEGFTLGQEVDYIADRRGDEVLSERGVPCAGAIDPALCQSKLGAAANSFGRNLLTTERDEVRIWESPAAVSLFGGIDTASEAAWIAAGLDYHVPCNALVAQVFDLYVFDGVEAGFGCLEAQALVTLAVNPSGNVSELNFALIEGAVCEPDPIVQGFAGGTPVPPPPPVPF